MVDNLSDRDRLVAVNLASDISYSSFQSKSIEVQSPLELRIAICYFVIIFDLL